jgi:hypothetical protein
MHFSSKEPCRVCIISIKQLHESICQFVSRYQNFVLVDSKPGECHAGSCGLVLAHSLPVPSPVRLKFCCFRQVTICCHCVYIILSYLCDSVTGKL